MERGLQGERRERGRGEGEGGDEESRGSGGRRGSQQGV